MTPLTVRSRGHLVVWMRVPRHETVLDNVGRHSIGDMSESSSHCCMNECWCVYEDRILAVVRLQVSESVSVAAI